jgi:beta-lactam-binding protein with PASTA domain
VTPKHDEQAPEGRVLDWAPKGVELPKGNSVELTVSSGPAPRVIPDLSGRSYDAAAAELSSRGLVAVRSEAFNDTVPRDRVAGTNPRAGASVARGARVTVIVSKGPDLVTVPELIGRPVDDATARLQAAGLKVGSVFGPPRARRVLFSTPPPGDQAKRGSSVNLYTV